MWYKIYSIKTRANRRKLEFMREFEIIEDEETLEAILNSSDDKRINIIFRYLLTPIEIK